MDKHTQLARQRMKAQRTKRGELSPFEARGLGKKGKPSTTFPVKQCHHRDKDTNQRCLQIATISNVEIKTRFGKQRVAFCFHHSIEANRG